jgi:hypothetical protein
LFEAAYAETFTQYARDENDRIEDETLEAGDHRGIFGTFDLELMFDAGWNAARKSDSACEHGESKPHIVEGPSLGKPQPQLCVGPCERGCGKQKHVGQACGW